MQNKNRRWTSAGYEKETLVRTISKRKCRLATVGRQCKTTHSYSDMLVLLFNSKGYFYESIFLIFPLPLII
jgi:hypothetical protein